jgi:hypothetical protein
MIPDVKRRSKRWRKFLLAIGVLSCLLVSLYFYAKISAERHLRAAVARADALDPEWRLEELEVNREVIAKDQNSALCVLAAKSLKPASWPSPNFENVVQANLEDERQLESQQIAVLRTELAKVFSAVAEARKIADLPQGRYAITWSPDGQGTLMPHIPDVRETADLLGYDVLLQAQEDKPDEALRSCRAILNSGRSLGDEPTFIAVLVRMAIRAMFVGKLQRTLAQGQPSTAALQSLQKLLEDEDSCPLLLIGARGERAFGDRTMQSLQAGQAKLSMGARVGALLGPGPSGSSGSLSGWIESVMERIKLGSLSNNRAALLEYTTELVEIAKLAEAEQKSRLDQLEATIHARPPMVRLLAPACGKMAEAVRKNQALLRCTIAALAAERFRQEHGHWPDSLPALVPESFAKVPVDPYDDHDLRLRRLPDGLVIYSVGPDGVDDGGDVLPGPKGLPKDIGFRLWDVARRRQPARPPEASTKSNSGTKQ